MDFVISKYKFLMGGLSKKYKNITPFNEYILNSALLENIHLNSIIILRHDVDRIPNNSLKIAQLESILGLKGTYYFRIMPESYNPAIMNKIANMGHEIAYHYEDVDFASKRIKVKSKKDEERLIDLAYESFCKNLEMLRENFDINTICAHGSPRSKYDNKMIWGKYDYKKLRIIGEPYLDVDWNEWAYFTDTGRKWNGNSVSIRDKVNSKNNFNFKTTQNIIDNIDSLPGKVMFTIHPQRWNDNPILWTKELVSQNIKNFVKQFLVHPQHHSQEQI